MCFILIKMWKKSLLNNENCSISMQEGCFRTPGDSRFSTSRYCGLFQDRI